VINNKIKYLGEFAGSQLEVFSKNILSSKEEEESQLHFGLGLFWVDFAF
jgi:hypothetical protein